MTEPASTAGTGLAVKFGATLGAGLLGAIVMAAVDPPTTRRELFAQAASAGIGSMIFGPFAVRILSSTAPWYSLQGLVGLDYMEMVVPVYFVVGALSWGAFGALAKFRAIVRQRAGQAAANRVLGSGDGSSGDQP